MKLPSLHPREINRAVKKVGWYKERQKGGEWVKYKEGHPNPIAIPYHGGKDVKPGTLRAILKAASVSREEFLELLGKKKL
jgi:predicted RNA binding protein YcfA (HicA-like mRNA interferase family)